MSTPAKLSPGTVLITGLNGFVAPHVASLFLSHGWSVRGTVRSADKKERVLTLPVLQEGVQDSKVELVIVEDFLKSDWTEALDGVDAVVHAATPFDMTLQTYDEFGKPATEGTKRLIAAAAKFPSIKAFAFVSSIVAAYNLLVPISTHNGKTLTEEDWLPLTEEDAGSEGYGAVQWYCISKKYAELAARETHKAAGATYALSSYCPPGIYGPPEHLLSKSELAKAPGTDLSTSALYAHFNGGEAGVLNPEYNIVYVDVRDLALAIYAGIVTRSNERYLTANEPLTSQKIVDIARAIRPDLKKYIVKGQPGVNAELPAETMKVDTSKSQKELGIKYRTLEDTVRDTIAKFESMGVYDA